MTMLWGADLGALEVRTEGGETHLRASFPYGVETELAPGRHEVFEARAFANRIESGGEVHLLSGHDFEKPLASRRAGTLQIIDTPQAVIIEARISPATTWARDFLAANSSRLIRGLSPGFRVQTGGEKIESRGAGLLRRVVKADLFEFSAVTVPAYPAAQIEARSWSGEVNTGGHSTRFNSLKRWRP